MPSADDTAGMRHDQKRKAKVLSAMHDQRPLPERLFSLWGEFRAAGWQDMTYAPKDGTEIELVEMGSAGIFKARWHSFEHDSLGICGSWFGFDGGQEYPMRGVMWRAIKIKKTERTP